MITPLHQGISVPNMDESLQWYEKAFGFTLVSDKVIPMLNSRVAFVKLGDFELELFQYLGEDGSPLPEARRYPNEDLKTCGTKHVAYRVEDMGGVYRHLQDIGADIAIPPFPMEGDTVCFLRDNSGVLIELIEKGTGA